jgi:tetratricopeptide (TPR) repeat protein
LIKKILSLSLFGLLIFASCTTYHPQPPSFYFEPLAPDVVTNLSLEDRLLIEDAWNYIQQGYPEKARKLFSQLSPESPFYYIGLGYTAYLSGDKNTAKEYFQTALKYQPQLYLAYLGLAQIHLEEGDEEAALSELREILKRRPNHSWALTEYKALRSKKTNENLALARAALSQNNIEKAKKALLESLYYSPDSLEANLMLADIYLKEKNYDQALIHLQTVYQKEPENHEILKKYGELLFLRQNYKKSLEIYQKLQQLRPEDKKIKDTIERLKNRLGIFELPSQFERIPSREALTKEDIAALLGVKFKDYLEKSPGQPPILIDIATSWAAKFILTTASLGLLDVYPNHTFQPKKVVTRAEFAEIIYRLVKYLEKKGHRFIQQIPPERIQITDVSPDNYYYQPILFVISYDLMALNPDKKFETERPISGIEAIKTLDIIISLIR